MTDATTLTVLGSMGALVLVGVAVHRHGRRGAPVGRYALIWAAILAAAFAIALTIGR